MIFTKEARKQNSTRLQSKFGRIFHFSYRKTTLCAANIFDGGEFGYQELAKFIHIRYTDFQNIVIISTYVKTLQNFIEFVDFLLKFNDVLFAMLNELYVTKHNKSSINLILV